MTTDSIISRVWSFCNTLLNIDEIDGNSFISSTDALIAQPSLCVLTHPPFGKKWPLVVMQRI